MNATLFSHQQKAKDFILRNSGSGALFMEVGTGKTLTALAIKEELKCKMIVVCPISLINAAWGEDIRKFTDFSYSNLRDKHYPDADIYIINFESYRLKDFSFLGCDMIVIDESSKIKNHKAQITKKILKDTRNFKYRIVMSGNPCPNSEDEYWSQLKFVKPHSLPDSFYRFRNLYFHLQRGTQTFGGNPYGKFALQEAFKTGFKYTLSDRNRIKLMEKIKPYIFEVKKKDCLDLPDQIDEVREVTLSPSQQKAYNNMRIHMITEIKEKHIVAQTALTKLMKLRQITAGFGIDESGEAKDLEDNSKLKELKSILEEIGNKQVIIWCQFHKEIETLDKELGSVATLYSLTKDKDESIELFKSGKRQYLVAHPKSAGHGLTFVNSDTQIFYSISYSNDEHLQARGRTHRPGQKNNCTYIYLLAKNTIDYEIKESLERKENVQKLCDRILNSA